MKKYNINMQFLRRSRKKPQQGDVFVFKMPVRDPLVRLGQAGGNNSISN